MVPLTDIKNLFAESGLLIAAVRAVYPDFKLIRANQTGEPPAYPYGTYLIMSDSNESSYQNIRVATVNEDDDQLVDVKRYEKTKIKISLTFLDKNKTERPYAIAELILRWMKSTAGKEECLKNNLVPILVNPMIQDRTVLNDDLYWETRWGFDLRFDTSTSTTEEIETVDSITMTTEVNDENEETHIIDMAPEGA